MQCLLGVEVVDDLDVALRLKAQGSRLKTFFPRALSLGTAADESPRGQGLLIRAVWANEFSAECNGRAEVAMEMTYYGANHYLIMTYDE